MGREVSMREAAEAVGLNRLTLHRWIKAGKLKPLRREVVEGYSVVATIVDLDDVRRLAKDAKPGRPRKKD